MFTKSRYFKGRCFKNEPMIYGVPFVLKLLFHAVLKISLCLHSLFILTAVEVDVQKSRCLPYHSIPCFVVSRPLLYDLTINWRVGLHRAGWNQLTLVH